MKFAAEVLLKDHSEEATFAFVSGDEETVMATPQPVRGLVDVCALQGGSSGTTRGGKAATDGVSADATGSECRIGGSTAQRCLSTRTHDRGQLLSKDVALAGEDSGGCIFVVYMWMQSAVLR